MKKHGFTLAEVLITLGIIGVVSALVIPTFTAQTQNAKIGPRVGKAISSFEQATKAMIEDAGADCLSGATVKVGSTDYALANAAGTTAVAANFVQALSSHMKGGVNTSDPNTFVSADGIAYTVGTTGNVGNTNQPHHNNYINELTIDVNGPAEPNRDARDRFYFSVADDGSLVAWGSRGNPLNFGAGSNPTQHARSVYWDHATNGCPEGKKPSVSGAKFCAGHVVENGMKALYK